jgi:hypothetical protein
VGGLGVVPLLGEGAASVSLRSVLAVFVFVLLMVMLPGVVVPAVTTGEGVVRVMSHPATQHAAMRISNRMRRTPVSRPCRSTGNLRTVGIGAVRVSFQPQASQLLLRREAPPALRFVRR